MAKLGIIGYGIVGKATDYSMEVVNDIVFYDKYKDYDYLFGKIKYKKELGDVVKQSEYVFICLPTPFNHNTNRIDLSIIDECIESITPMTNSTDKIVIIKSTVVPGTTLQYIKKYPSTNFCFNPEFLTEANYLEDSCRPDRIVIGAENNNVMRRVADLYRNIFPSTKMFLTDTMTAETVKYMANCYLATKVMFANEMFDLCERLGIKYEEVKKMVVADSRIYDSHLDVTTLRGFGGKCFPKDIVSLIGKFNELGIDCSLLETVWNKNLKIRKKRDWEEIPGAVS